MMTLDPSPLAAQPAPASAPPAAQLLHHELHRLLWGPAPAAALAQTRLQAALPHASAHGFGAEHDAATAMLALAARPGGALQLRVWCTLVVRSRDALQPATEQAPPRPYAAFSRAAQVPAPGGAAGGVVVVQFAEAWGGAPLLLPEAELSALPWPGRAAPAGHALDALQFLAALWPHRPAHVMPGGFAAQVAGRLRAASWAPQQSERARAALLAWARRLEAWTAAEAARGTPFGARTETLAARRPRRLSLDVELERLAARRAARQQSATDTEHALQQRPPTTATPGPPEVAPAPTAGRHAATATSSQNTPTPHPPKTPPRTPPRPNAPSGQPTAMSTPPRADRGAQGITDASPDTPKGRARAEPLRSMNLARPAAVPSTPPRATRPPPTAPPATHAQYARAAQTRPPEPAQAVETAPVPTPDRPTTPPVAKAPSVLSAATTPPTGQPIDANPSPKRAIQPPAASRPRPTPAPPSTSPPRPAAAPPPPDRDAWHTVPRRRRTGPPLAHAAPPNAATPARAPSPAPDVPSTALAPQVIDGTAPPPPAQDASTPTALDATASWAALTQALADNTLDNAALTRARRLGEAHAMPIEALAAWTRGWAQAVDAGADPRRARTLEAVVFAELRRPCTGAGTKDRAARCIGALPAAQANLGWQVALALGVADARTLCRSHADALLPHPPPPALQASCGELAATALSALATTPGRAAATLAADDGGLASWLAWDAALAPFAEVLASAWPAPDALVCAWARAATEARHLQPASIEQLTPQAHLLAALAERAILLGPPERATCAAALLPSIEARLMAKAGRRTQGRSELTAVGGALLAACPQAAAGLAYERRAAYALVAAAAARGDTAASQLARTEVLARLETGPVALSWPQATELLTTGDVDASLQVVSTLSAQDGLSQAARDLASACLAAVDAVERDPSRGLSAKHWHTLGEVFVHLAGARDLPLAQRLLPQLLQARGWLAQMLRRGQVMHVTDGCAALSDLVARGQARGGDACANALRTLRAQVTRSVFAPLSARDRINVTAAVRRTYQQLLVVFTDSEDSLAAADVLRVQQIGRPSLLRAKLRPAADGQVPAAGARAPAAPARPPQPSPAPAPRTRAHDADVADPTGASVAASGPSSHHLRAALASAPLSVRLGYADTSQQFTELVTSEVDALNVAGHTPGSEAEQSALWRGLELAAERELSHPWSGDEPPMRALQAYLHARPAARRALEQELRRRLAACERELLNTADATRIGWVPTAMLLGRAAPKLERSSLAASLCAAFGVPTRGATPAALAEKSEVARELHWLVFDALCPALRAGAGAEPGAQALAKAVTYALESPPTPGERLSVRLVYALRHAQAQAAPTGTVARADAEAAAAACFTYVVHAAAAGPQHAAEASLVAIEGLWAARRDPRAPSGVLDAFAVRLRPFLAAPATAALRNLVHAQLVDEMVGEQADGANDQDVCDLAAFFAGLGLSQGANVARPATSANSAAPARRLRAVGRALACDALRRLHGDGDGLRSGDDAVEAALDRVFCADNERAAAGPSPHGLPPPSDGVLELQLVDPWLRQRLQRRCAASPATPRLNAAIEQRLHLSRSLASMQLGGAPR